MNGKSTLPGELSHPSTRSVVHWKCWPHWVSSHADLRASSTPPGYSICAWQCSTNTNCYCISPRDILGSSQAGSSNAGTRGPSCQRRAAELLDRWPQCPLYSRLSMRSPKQAGLLGGLPTLSLPGSQVLPPLCFFSSPFASVLLMFPLPPPLLPITGTP